MSKTASSGQLEVAGEPAHHKYRAAGELAAAASGLVQSEWPSPQQQQSIRPAAASTLQAKPASSSAPLNSSPTSSSNGKQQQLSARAKAITAKLSESSGAELRRTLFSLRQMFQDEPRLSVEFVDSPDALHCLLKVAARSESDQIHQNYILRAIGQLIAHPVAMNGLAQHCETIQWLYSLLGSQHRLVARSALSLLLTFVEANDNNCLRLCQAIRAVDGSKGALPWTKLSQLFSSSSSRSIKDAASQQDLSLAADAMTLVNKTLIRVPDQASFFEFAQPLGKLVEVEALGRKLAPLTATDAQLRQQFQLFQRTLKAGGMRESNSAAAPVSLRAEKGCGESGCIISQMQQMEQLQQPARTTATGTQLNNDRLKQSPEANEQPIGTLQLDEQQPDLETERATTAHLSPSSQTDMMSQPVGVSPAAAGMRLHRGDNDTFTSCGARDNNNSKQFMAASRVGSQLPPLDSMPPRINTNTNNNNAIIIKPQRNNLARGKQQRASISSCSSSDSYASYGSGYASGSGNSTDHEPKPASQPQAAGDTLSTCLAPANANQQANQQQQQREPDSNQQPQVLSLKVSSTATPGQRKLSGGSLVVVGAGGANEAPATGLVPAATCRDAEDEDEDNESQLKKHLNELEQLTDDLANRASSPSLLLEQQQQQATNPLSTIPTTASNISSLSPASVGLASSFGVHKEEDDSQQQPHDESRSTSTTPTFTNSNSNSNNNSNNNNSNLKQAHMDPVANIQQLHQCKQPAKSSIGGPLPAAPVTQSGGTTTAKQEPYYHNLFQWEQLVGKGVTRPLFINDLDFTDLRDEDDCDLLNGGGPTHNLADGGGGAPLTIRIPNQKQAAAHSSPGHRLSPGQLEDSEDSGQGTGGSLEPHEDADNSSSRPQPTGSSLGPPPPMPPPLISPWFNTFTGSRPHSQLLLSSPSPPGAGNQSPAYSSYSRNSAGYLTAAGQPAMQTTTTTGAPGHQYNTLQPVSGLRSASSMSSLLFGGNRYMNNNNKRKKTMKLFWKEVREDRSLLLKLTKKRTIWDEIKPVEVDTAKLEELFESKAKDLVALSKSRLGLDGLAGQRRAKISVLDAKRSNAINIGMTKLPPMRTIKSAILKMDSSIMNREGIEKILSTMMPSEEEKSRIIEAQLANPDTPLGTAEQFLLNLASISALEARLKLWAFQLDYAQIEKEVAEPLMDLKQAIDEIERSETFRLVLGTLLAIGNFLNSSNAKGFQIDYLEKVPEVKDTVHKHSLLHHLCLFIQEKYGSQETSDLYSEFGAVNRASKVDYSEVAKNLKKMQQDCKASWDHLRIVAKHDGLANLMNSSNSSSSSSAQQHTNNTCSNTTTTTCTATNNHNHNNTKPDKSTMPLQPKSSGKLNNLSKLSMITTVIGGANSHNSSMDAGSSTSSASITGPQGAQGEPPTKQLKTRVSDFLTDCAERIMVLMVIHRRVMNRFQKLLVYLGCPSHQIKQTQPQQILKIINEFALEYRTKRERVREMLMKQQQCQHRHRLASSSSSSVATGSRWQLNRNRWAGSQQCLSQDSYHHINSRPCSTASSYANSANCHSAPDGHSMCNVESTRSNRLNNNNNNRTNCDQQHHLLARASSPSAMSQVSSYEADYQGCCQEMHSCCSSRQQSVTPVPTCGTSANSNNNSVSMFELQQQQHHARRFSVADPQALLSSNGCRHEMEHDQDRKLKQLLGADKSLENACGDLYQMSHFTSTLARTSRHPPPTLAHSGKQQRAMSMDSTPAGAGSSQPPLDTASAKHQSSYYRYLHGATSFDGQPHQSEQDNSDDEILQSLLRTVTAKSSYTEASQHDDRRTSSNKSARNKILSRFSCDRKSLRRSPRGALELSNVG